MAQWLIRAEGGPAEPLVLDVLDTDVVRRTIAAAGPFAILINNAGTNRPRPFADVTPEDYDAVLERSKAKSIKCTNSFIFNDMNCFALMRRLDTRGAITFVDATVSGTCPLDRADMLARFHAREGGGPLLSGAAAFAAMWRAIPLLRPLGEAARNRRVLSIMERVYLRFLRVRPRLQRWLARREARA